MNMFKKNYDIENKIKLHAQFYKHINDLKL